MSEYAAQDLEKLATPPIVHDATMPDAASDDDAGPNTGVVVVVVGTLADGDSIVYDTGLRYFVPGAAAPPPEGGFVPTFIGPAETFTVPDNRQAIYAITIDNEGTIDIGENSYLIGIELP